MVRRSEIFPSETGWYWFVGQIISPNLKNKFSYAGFFWVDGTGRMHAKARRIEAGQCDGVWWGPVTDADVMRLAAPIDQRQALVGRGEDLRGVADG